MCFDIFVLNQHVKLININFQDVFEDIQQVLLDRNPDCSNNILELITFYTSISSLFILIHIFIGKLLFWLFFDSQKWLI
ncbi:hypothetical protein XBKB1_3120019 [Xenorhabdus bovienii str. kraussei Becker Underwood]|uniref:Uncharacterized protein n=1 Tax=Xenorhabdus bovienii str. kraussei Becker Underwood TaxID=1398204 RepID=A0A077PY84_XENBV|nr:hypothetical protein XBKB1_3120019 [Xenorhabdus bovienii str. kraussei Becker Underwood]